MDWGEVSRLPWLAPGPLVKPYFVGMVFFFNTKMGELDEWGYGFSLGLPH
jgi:hypothetical protein